MSADTDSAIGKRMREALRLIRDGAAAEPAAMDTAILNAHRHLSAAAGEYGEVALNVATNRISVQDEVVYKSEARENNLAFDLFRQGLRRITFRAGVQVDEVGAFVRSLAQTRDVSATDIDFVGTLWQEELEHIQYVAIDGFTEKLFMSEERFTSLFRGVIDDVAPGLLELEEDDVGDRKRRSYTPADDFDAMEAADNLDRAGLADAQQVASELTRIIQQGLGADALDHLARLLASVCVKDPQPLGIDQLGAMLTRLVDAYAEIGEWAGMAACARSFWALCQSAGSFRPAVTERLEALKPAIAGAPLLSAFLERLAEAPREPIGWLRWYLVDCGVIEAPDLLNLMKTSESEATTAYIKDLLHRQGTASLAPWAERLKDPNPVVVLEVLDVILHSPLAGQARALLVDCLQREEPEVRARAIEGLGIKYDLSVREAILPFLKDHDAPVRRAVVQLAVQAKDRSVAPYLAQLVKSSMFGGFEEDEQRQHFEALARLGGMRFFKVFETRLRLEGDGGALKRLFRRGDVTLTDDPIRRGALAGLALLGTPEAVAMIRDVQSRADLTLAGHCDVVMRMAARGAHDDDTPPPIAAAPEPIDDLSRSAGLLGDRVLFQPAEVLVAPPSRPRPTGAPPPGAPPPSGATPRPAAEAPKVDTRPLAERPLLGAEERFELNDHRQLTASPSMSEGGRFRLTSPRAAIVGVTATSAPEPVQPVTLSQGPVAEISEPAPPPSPRVADQTGRRPLPPRAPQRPSHPPEPRIAGFEERRPERPLPMSVPPAPPPPSAGGGLEALLRGYLDSAAPAAAPPAIDAPAPEDLLRGYLDSAAPPSASPTADDAAHDALLRGYLESAAPPGAPPRFDESGPDALLRGYLDSGEPASAPLFEAPEPATPRGPARSADPAPPAFAPADAHLDFADAPIGALAEDVDAPFTFDAAPATDGAPADPDYVPVEDAFSFPDAAFDAPAAEAWPADPAPDAEAWPADPTPAAEPPAPSPAKKRDAPGGLDDLLKDFLDFDLGD